MCWCYLPGRLENQPSNYPTTFGLPASFCRAAGTTTDGGRNTGRNELGWDNYQIGTCFLRTVAPPHAPKVEGQRAVDARCQTLVDMGFDRAVAERALQENGGDVNFAIAMLLTVTDHNGRLMSCGFVVVALLGWSAGVLRLHCVCQVDSCT